METINIDIMVLDDNQKRLSSAIELFKKMASETIGNLKVVDGNCFLNNYQINFQILDCLPTSLSAQDVSDKIFFSASGSNLWNYVANQSFYSVCFSNILNKYYDECYNSYYIDEWQYVEAIFMVVLGAIIRKYGDKDDTLVDDATFIINEITSHNKNKTHYKKVFKNKSAYSSFMSFAYSIINKLEN